MGKDTGFFMLLSFYDVGRNYRSVPSQTVFMKEYAEKFYKSKSWQKCRAGYIKSVGGLCERCLKEGRITPGVIVHHKIYITPNNIHCPEIVMDWGNLELLCREHHEQEHRKIEKRYKVDEEGRVCAV